MLKANLFMFFLLCLFIREGMLDDSIVNYDMKWIGGFCGRRDIWLYGKLILTGYYNCYDKNVICSNEVCVCDINFVWDPVSMNCISCNETATAKIPNAFRYADGSTNIFNWQGGQPDNWKGNSTFVNEGCVEIYNNGLNDLSCSETKAYICEMNLCKANQYYEKNTRKCTDLKSVNVACLSTDECSTGLECLFGICKSGCPLSWSELNGRCFKLFDGPLAKKDAQKDCQSKGSTLANSNSDQKFEFLYRLVSDGRALIGASGIVPLQLMNDDGSIIFGRKKIGPNKNGVDSSVFIESCVEINNGLLNNVSCLKEEAYICEMNLCESTQYFDTNTKKCTNRKSIYDACLSTDECNANAGLVCHLGKCV